MIPPYEQVALLSGWVHIRFCSCGVNEDVAAANVPDVKIRTTATTIAARVLIIAMLFIHVSNDMSVYLTWVS
jgi:hypothetical protein